MRGLLAALLLQGCTGWISVPTAAPPASPAGLQPAPSAPAPVAAQVELRRLTPREIDLSLAELVGDTRGLASASMPAEDAAPFDNDYPGQVASAAWLEAAEQVAQQAAAFAIADPTRRDALIGCRPAGARDADCLRAFTRRFGRRALRRPLTDDEVVLLSRLPPSFTSEGDFYDSVAWVIERLLLDPEFLFRVERGVPVAGQSGVFALSQHELASRLSFFLQGRAPPDWLLDLADANALASPDAVRRAAQRLLDAPEGHAQVQLFHAQWLGYSSLPDEPQLAQSLTQETQALVELAAFGGDHHQLFLSPRTYLDETLARHYGMNAPADGGFGWVEYDNPLRLGILAHGSVLGNGVKGGDTSPTLRGKWVRKRLLCTEIGPPPPNAQPNLPADDPSGPCKTQRYAAHAQGGCASCHQQMDPVGFGLEQFDATGAFRLMEPDHPSCAESSSGTLDGASFSGPSGLARLLTASTELDACAMQQLFRFSAGRAVLADDAPTVAWLASRYQSSGRRFDSLLLDLVSSPTFAQRREPSP